jgi:uncharacterized SAM-binding protein YcdF (DUF218 family)
MTTNKTQGTTKQTPSTIQLFVLAIVLFYLFIVFTHRFWLPFVADFLVLKNQPRQTDLIVVATPFRPRFLYALDLLQKGYAEQILFVGDNRIKSPGNGETTSDLAKLEALKRGIPESKIHLKHSTGTRADALQAKLLMSALGLKSALVVSDPYNMRRLDMIFNYIFKDTGLELSLVPTNQKRKTPDYWWLSPHSFVYVIKEWIKLPMNYYLLTSRDIKSIPPPQVPKEKPLEKFSEPFLEKDDLFSRQFSQKFFRLVKFKIGEFLVVDENKAGSDVAITSELSPRVSFCYEKGICRKIFLFYEGWRDTKEIHNRAKKLRIDLNDLIMIPHAMGDAYQTTRFINQLMEENHLQAASIFLPYYETRKFQFYFKRFLNSDFTIQIKPLESRYRHLLEHWLQNTGLGNLYLDQYLIMTHYYFNKLLWS